MAARKSSYSVELEALENDLSKLEAKTAIAREQLAKLEMRARKTKSRIWQLRTAAGARLGLPSSRNSGVYCAWAAFKRASWDRRAVAMSEIFEALQDDLPDLKRETLRSYLRRMKQAGLIEKKGAYWHRTASDTDRLETP
jgi:hypothetical protein